MDEGYDFTTQATVILAGDYMTHQELAPVLDELQKHFFRVTSRKDKWEGPAAGYDIVLTISIVMMNPSSTPFSLS